MLGFRRLYRSSVACIKPDLFALAAFALLLVSCDKTDCPPTCGCVTEEPPAVEYNGWLPMSSGTRANLNAVWGFDTGEAYAVGDNGTILYYDGISWERLNSGTQADLLGVWGGLPDRVLVTGEGGTILRGGPAGWEPMESGTTEPIGSIDGSVIDNLDFAYAVGGGPPGTILHFDGTTWSQISTGGADRFIDLQAWSTFHYFPMVISWAVVAVGENGSAYCLVAGYPRGVYDWVEMDTGTNEDLVAVFGEVPNNAYAVSRGGTIIQNTKQFVTTGPTRSWRKVAELSGDAYSGMAARTYNDLFIVGDKGRIDNFDRLDIAEMPSGMRADLNSVWAGEDDVYAVGDGGVILINSDQPKTCACPVNASITVGPGVKPTLSWTPECPVSKIIVEDDEGNCLRFTTADGNLIRPGVRWEATPSGAVEYHLPVSLLEGNVYTVTLIRREWNNERAIGTWNFVPAETGAPSLTAVTRADDPEHTERPSLASDSPGKFYIHRLVALTPEPPPPGEPEEFLSYAVSTIMDGPWRWFGDPAYREDQLDIRRVIVITPVRNPETGEIDIITREDLRAADVWYFPSYTMVWDVLDVE